MAITIDELISQGNDLKQTIEYVKAPSGVMRSFSVHKFSDHGKYEVWKNKSLRYLSSEFNGDRCINDFEDAIKELEKNRYSSKIFDKLLGVLVACKEFGRIESISTIKSPFVHIENHNTQNQEQSISTNIAYNIFIDAIKDELKGRELKEIKAIVDENAGDLDKAKPALISKLLSFGESTLTNIVANIITNPNIWGGV